jgi:hypothetical protein
MRRLRRQRFDPAAALLFTLAAMCLAVLLRLLCCKSL